MKTINTPKRVIKNQQYENYWKSTLALTDFNSTQFLRTLKMIVEHIDKHDLSNKSLSELIKGTKSLNQEVTHSQELEKEIFKVFPTDSNDCSSTRKQINTFVKLGFVKPFLSGYHKNAKKYYDEKTNNEERKRLFSEIVYENASLNSAKTLDDTSNNQIKFIVKTLMSKSDRKLTKRELVGLMQLDLRNKSHASEKEVREGAIWAEKEDFIKRKYNQVSHLKSILKNIPIFTVENIKGHGFEICLTENAKEVFTIKGDKTRDSFRMTLMKHAVYMESLKIYGKKVSWFSKLPGEGMVCSHIYDLATALENWDVEEAYDPNNALLLLSGDEDQYFDKRKMTFDLKGNPIFSEDVRDDFIELVQKNNWKLDSAILTEKRKKYLKIHNEAFDKKNN